MAGRLNAAFGDLGVDELAHIFGFLPRHDIMRARVCTTWRDAAKMTLVPLTNFRVERHESNVNCSA